MIRPVRADGRIDTGGVFTPIQRPRVTERIASAALHPIVMLVAPAGYGKSTAIAQFTATLDERVVCYNLRADGATLLGFVRGFADALTDIAPGARTTVTSAYESAQSSPTPGAELATWMHAHVKSYSGLIVIDDLHIAEAEPEVSRFLVDLIDLSKGRLRWLLASRSYLNLPVGSWMAYEQMELAVDETELAFTPGEAREVARASRVGMRDEELARLVDMTEGWPTALSFALRSSTRSLDLSKIEVVTRELVYRYLAEQVYGSLDEGQREFLTVAVVLPEVDVRILIRAGYDDALARIEDLRHHGAFIVVDAEREGIYLCHDLFREFVRHQAGKSGETSLRAAYYRTAVALEGAGRVDDALIAYADSGDGESILRILDAKGLDLMEAGKGDVIARALQALDGEARASNSIALAMRGIAESNAGRFEQAEALLHRAADRAADPAIGAQFTLREARIALNRGNDGARERLERIDDDEQLPDDVRLEARAMLTIVLTRRGELEGAEVARASVLASLGRCTAPGVRARVLQRIAVSLLEAGQGLAARDLFMRVVDDATALGMHSLASKACANLATLSGKVLNDQSQRMWYAQKAFSAAAKGGDVFDQQTASLILLSVEVERGNTDRIVAIEKSLGTIRTNDPSRLTLLTEARAECLSWEGKFEQAYRILSRCWQRGHFAADRIANAGLCAIYAAASARPVESVALIAEAQRISTQEAGRVDEATIEMTLLWCALAQAIGGRHTIAQRELRRPARSETLYIRVLRQAVESAMRVMRGSLLESSQTKELIAELAALGYGGHAKLLEAVLEAFPAREKLDPSVPNLTRTEAEVLRRLASGLSPKDIAAEMGRSINTILVHIQKATLGLLG